jgi:uncharacterized protein involved in copper resistance
LATRRSHYFASDESLAGAHLDPARGCAALGVRGLAPLGVDVEATVYAGGASRTAAPAEILLTPTELMLTRIASWSACVFGCRERDLWKS